MAERMTVEIAIGGPVPRHLVPGLLQAIQAEAIYLTGEDKPFSADSAEDLLRAARDGNAATTLNLMDHEVAWGHFETLEPFLKEHNIAFDRWSEGKYEFDAELLQFRPGMTQPFCCATLQNQEPVVEARLVASALESLERGEHERAANILRAALGPDVEPLQPFTIE